MWPIFNLYLFLKEFFHILFSFFLCNILVRMLKNIFFKLKMLFAHKKLKKPPQKVAYLRQLGVFFSVQPRLPKTIQNFKSVLYILLSNRLC